MDPQDAADKFKALGDPVRLQLLAQITARPGICVCELSTKPPLAAGHLSYHLKVLRDAGLVESTRRGRWMHYQPCETVIAQLQQLLSSPTSVDADYRSTASC